MLISPIVVFSNSKDGWLKVAIGNLLVKPSGEEDPTYISNSWV